MKKLLTNHFFYLTIAFLLILVIYFSGIDKTLDYFGKFFFTSFHRRFYTVVA